MYKDDLSGKKNIQYFITEGNFTMPFISLCYYLLINLNKLVM